MRTRLRVPRVTDPSVTAGDVGGALTMMVLLRFPELPVDTTGFDSESNQ